MLRTSAILSASTLSAMALVLVLPSAASWATWATPGTREAQVNQGPPAVNLWQGEVDEAKWAETKTALQAYADSLREGVPEVEIEVYRDWVIEERNHIQIFLRAADSSILEDVIDALDNHAAHALGRALIDEHDSYLRLVSFDAEREERLAPIRPSCIVWRARASLAGRPRAAAWARAMVERLHELYPEVYARAYDEYFPRTGHIMIRIHAPGIGRWETIEREMHADPGFVELFEEAREIFLEGSFDDHWMIRITL